MGRFMLLNKNLVELRFFWNWDRLAVSAEWAVDKTKTGFGQVRHYR